MNKVYIAYDNNNTILILHFCNWNYHETELQNDKDSIEIFEKALTSEDISNWFSEGNPLVLHYLAPRSLGRLPLAHPLRSACIRLMLSKWFDRVILAAICANALFLAADNPLVTSYTTVSQGQDASSPVWN